MLNSSNDLYGRISIGSSVTIRGEAYKVKGAMHFEDSGYRWVEYELTQSGKQSVWLTFELMGSPKPALYNKVYLSNKETLEQITYDGEIFSLVESGKAYITSAYGSVDVEMGDTVGYYEYANSTDDKYLSIEQWDDMTECSIGTALSEDEISLPPECSASNEYSSNFTSSYSGNFIDKIKDAGRILIFMLIIMVVIIIETDIDVSGLFINKSVDKFLKKDANFVYATSITGDVDNKQKAIVYKTEMSLSETSKYIINNVPGISYANENSGSDSLGMINDKEYIFVYISDDAQYDTYVQVSPRKYTYTNRNHIYRPRHFWSDSFYRDYYYDKGYGTDYSKYGGSSSYSSYKSQGYSTNSQNDSVYSSLISSTRQSSVGSRSSVGGGTSFGK